MLGPGKGRPPTSAAGSAAGVGRRVSDKTSATASSLLLDSSTVVKTTQQHQRQNTQQQQQRDRGLQATERRAYAAAVGARCSGTQSSRGSATIAANFPGMSTSFPACGSWTNPALSATRALYTFRSTSVGEITASSVSSDEVETTYRQRNLLKSPQSQKCVREFLVDDSGRYERTGRSGSLGACGRGTRQPSKSACNRLSTTASSSPGLSAVTRHARMKTTTQKRYAHPSCKNAAPSRPRLYGSDRSISPSVCGEIRTEDYVRNQVHRRQVAGPNGAPGLDGRFRTSVRSDAGTQTDHDDLIDCRWLDNHAVENSAQREEFGNDSDVDAERELAAIERAAFERGARQTSRADHAYYDRPLGPDIDMMTAGKRLGLSGALETGDDLPLEDDFAAMCLFTSSTSSEGEEFESHAANRHLSQKTAIVGRGFGKRKDHQSSQVGSFSGTLQTDGMSTPLAFEATPPHGCLRPAASRPYHLNDDGTVLMPASGTAATAGAKSPLSTRSAETSSSSALSSLEGLSSPAHSVSSYSTLPSSISSPDSSKVANLASNAGRASAFSPPGAHATHRHHHYHTEAEQKLSTRTRVGVDYLQRYQGSAKPTEQARTWSSDLQMTPGQDRHHRHRSNVESSPSWIWRQSRFRLGKRTDG